MPIAPKITYTILDADGDPAETSIHVPSGDTLVRYGEFAIAHAEVMEDILLGRFVETAKFSVPLDISALTGNTLIDTSDVEQISAFQFSDEDGEPVDVNVPGLNPTMVVDGTDGLDQADTAIAAFITLMEDGDGIISPSSVAEADIQSTIYARKETRSSGRKRR